MITCDTTSNPAGATTHSEVGRTSRPPIRFSIIITCHNQRDFIQDAVDSALFQGVSSKEIIVVDDASDDGCAEILQQYGDSIVLAPLQANLGAVGARNYGASLAKGEYLVFLDGDDALMPWALGIYDRIISIKHPKIILGRLLFFSGPIRSIKGVSVPSEFEVVEYSDFMEKDRSYRASASSIVVDRQRFLAVNGWSSGMFPIEDVDLVTKLGYSGPTVLITSPKTIFYRIHDTNAIHDVAPFMGLVQKIIHKAKSGEYPSRSKRRFELFAFVGGPIAFWVKRACRAGRYADGMRIAAKGWRMILAAIVRRGLSKLKGRQRTEVFALEG